MILKSEQDFVLIHRTRFYNKPWRKHTGQLCGMTSLDVVIYLILELYFLLHDSSRRSLIIIFLKLIIGAKFEDTIDKS